MKNNPDYEQLFNKFSKLKVLIIGDVMIDAYLWGKVERISPEAPVPIVQVNRRANRLGGAANVALNIRAMGAEPFLCSVIGNDYQANLFLDLLKTDNINQDGILKSDDRVTTTKFRVIGNSAQMLRVDEEIVKELSQEDQTQFIKKIEQLIKVNAIDVVIFQDYDKGVLNKHIIEKLMLLFKGKIPVAVDPKKKNFFHYKGVDLFKPNLKELQDATNSYFDKKDIDRLKQEVEKLQNKLQAKIFFTTRSEQGVYVNEMEKVGFSSEIIPAHVRSIADVSGAGDTVISIAALGLALKTDKKILAELSNLAGGLVCEELGVIPIDKEKLLKETIKIYG